MSDLFDELNLLDENRSRPFVSGDEDVHSMYADDGWNTDDDDDDDDDEIEDFDYVGNFG